MRRLALALVVVAVLAAGSAAVVSARSAAQTAEGTGWACPGWGGGPGTADPAGSPMLKQLADKMGMSPSDLAAELQGGKSVADVAKARNVELQTLVDLLVAPRVEMMTIGVKYGYHTQEQADAMQKYVAERISYQLQQKGFSGWGHGMMGGGMMGPGTGGLGGMMGRDTGGFGGMMGPGTGGFGGMMRGWR